MTAVGTGRQTGEGIGTGIFANGRLLRGESGLAGEFGHVQLQPDGPLCGCGNLGCWEMLASTYLEPPLAARVGARLGLGSTPTEASLVEALQARG